LARETDAARGEVREVYRVVAQPLGPQGPPPSDLAILSAEFPGSMTRDCFYEIPLILTTGDGSFDGQVEMGYRIRFKDLVMNLNDQVEHAVRMQRSGRGRWEGKLLFVCPYESGEYEVEIYVQYDSERRVLRAAAGGGFLYTIKVM
jgi:hypothetical protein